MHHIWFSCASRKVYIQNESQVCLQYHFNNSKTLMQHMLGRFLTAILDYKLQRGLNIIAEIVFYVYANFIFISVA